jgi:hypothetical protein
MSIVLEVLKRRRTLIIICALLFGVLIAGLSYRNHYFQSAEESQASGAHCDDGVGAAKPRTAAVASATAPDLIASAQRSTTPNLLARLTEGSL